MKLAAGYAAAATAASSGVFTAGKANGPEIWTSYVGGIGLPVVPALIGIITCILVRVIVGVGSPPLPAAIRPRNLITYNIAVTLLAMMGTAAYIADANISGPGRSFLIGLTCGGIGEGFVRIGRTQFLAGFKAGLRTMIETIYRSRDPQ